MLVKTKYFTTDDVSCELHLENGTRFWPFTIAYETYGELNADKSNVILICHALTGDSHAAFGSEENPDDLGWWDNYIGPNKAIDTNKYFVVSSNVIGSCRGSSGPNSINHKTKKHYGLSFPVITILDMVQAQKILIDFLQIKNIKAVIGGSMGGMQALTWSIAFPHMVEKCIVIASTAKLSTQALAFDAVGRNAIISDPLWANGNYYELNQKPKNGLAIARMIGHITYLSDEFMDIKFGRKLQKQADYGYHFATEFQVESYLKYQGDKFVDRFDANSYLYITKAIGYFDLEKKYGSLEKAFEKVMAKFLIIAFKSDWLYPPQDSKKIVNAFLKLNKEVSYFESDSPYGHDAFLLPDAELTEVITSFIS
ncbi:MAG: homoserine O-acetyltransferase [Candidatus Margulisiibacteriota bacterium]